MMGLFGKLVRSVVPAPAALRLVCVEYYTEHDLAKALRFVRRHSELLRPEVLDLMARIASEKTDDEVRHVVLARRALLRHCGEVGVERAFGEWTKSPDEGAALFSDFLDISDLDEARAFVEANPSLMDHPTRAVLDKLVDGATDVTERRRYETCRGLLERARDDGIAVAFEDFARASWADPLRPYPGFGRELEREEFAPLLVAILGASNWQEWTEAVRAHPAAVADPRTDTALLRVMLLSKSWTERMRIGQYRARLALCRHMGVEVALSEKWRIGFVPDELMFAEIEASGAGGTHAKATFLDLLGRVEDVSSKDELFALFDAYPGLVPKLAVRESQTSFMGIPTWPEPPAGFEREAVALDVLTAAKAPLWPAVVDVIDAVFARAREAPPYLRTVALFYSARGMTEQMGPVIDEELDEFLEFVRSLYDDTLAIFTSDMPLDRATILRALAEHHVKAATRRPAQAPQHIALALEALDEARALVSEDGSLFLADLHQMTGALLLRHGTAADAADRAVESFEAALRLLTPPWAAQTGALSNLGRAHMRRGDLQAAVSAFLRRIDISNQLAAESPFGAGQQQEAGEAASTYHLAALCLARLGKAEDAFRLLEQGKARLLAQLLPPRAALQRLDPESRAKAAPAARALMNSLTGFPKLDGPFPDDPLTWGAIAMDMRKKARADWEEMLASVQRPVPAGETPGATAPRLSENSAAVALCVTEFGALAIILLAGGALTTVEIAGFTNERLNQLLLSEDDGTSVRHGWMLDILNMIGRPSSPRKTADAIDAMLAELRPLLTPIVDRLPVAVTTLYLLADGKLGLLPLHAVPLDEDGTERLLDRFSVSYAPSMAALNHSLAGASPDTLAVYAYANAGVEGELAFAQAEIRAIGRQFDGAVLHDSTGDKVELLRAAQGRQVVHFACHAKFDTESAGQSYLELHDDELTLDEIQAGDLNLGDCRLVALSACQTGVIDPRSFDEYIGFPAAFLVAGARCVVGSLWEVSDISTAMLMQRFYRHFRQDPQHVAQALGSAQKWMREARVAAVAAFAAECAAVAGAERKSTLEAEVRRWEAAARRNPDARPFAHPYFWAAFTVTGA